MYLALVVAELREAIRTAIPVVVECLKDKDPWVRKFVIKALSSIAAHSR